MDVGLITLSSNYSLSCPLVGPSTCASLSSITLTKVLIALISELTTVVFPGSILQLCLHVLDKPDDQTFSYDVSKSLIVC